MPNLTPWLEQKFFLADGVTPNAGGKVFTYYPGTSTKKPTYTSESGSANTNPIILDSTGRCNLWLDAGGYKIVNAPANDTDPPAAAVKTWDSINVSGTTGDGAGIVASIAALRALAEGAFTTVNVLGYYSANGVGAGLYYWDETNVTADNGGTVIAPTVSDGTGRWILIQDGPINVTQFGAKGDGAADDTPAVKAAISAAPAGAKIEFQSGLTYLLSTTVGNFKAGQKFFGYGATLKRKNGSATTHTPSSASYSFGYSPDNGQMFHVSVNNVAFYGIEFDGNKLNNLSGSNDQGDGIFFSGASGCIVEDCYFHDLFRDTVTFGSVSNDNTFHNNRVFNIGYSSSVNGGSGVAIISGSRNVVSSNHFKGDPSNATQAVSAIDIEPNSGSDICTGNIIIENTIDFVRLGQGMACYTNDTNGPSYPSFGNIYKGNTVYASDSSKAGDYAFQGRNCSALTLEGNFFRHGATFCCRIGGAYVKECKITGNYFKDSAGAGLQIPDSVKDCIVHGNHAINNALQGFTFNGGNRLSLKGNVAIGNGTASSAGTQYPGFLLSGHSNCIIEGNIAYLNYGHGMHLFAVSHVQVIGNQLLDNGQRADNESSSLRMSGTYDYIDLVKNVVGSQSATTNWVKYGISESGSASNGTVRFDSNQYESCRTAKTDINSAYVLQWMDENYVSGGSMATNTFLDLKSKITISYGTGSPDTVVVARPGSLFYRTDGAFGTSLYVKEKNTNANGWSPFLSMNGVSPINTYVPYGKVSGGDAYLAQKSTLAFDDSTDTLSVTTLAATNLSGKITLTADTFSNANKTVSTGTAYLAQIGTMTASRTVTLPAASGYPRGTQLIIADESGTTSVANTLVINRAGADTINGAASVTIGIAGGYDAITLMSNGSNAWTVLGKI